MIATPANQIAASKGVGSPVPAHALMSGPLKLASLPGPSKAEGAALPEGGGAASAVSTAELSEYQRRLYEIVERNSHYPEAARRLSVAGVTRLAFRLDRLGNVLESWVQESSGSELLDDAALDALKRSQPLPPIPPSLPSRMDFVIEIDSSLLRQVAMRTNG